MKYKKILVTRSVGIMCLCSRELIAERGIDMVDFDKINKQYVIKD